MPDAATGQPAWSRPADSAILEFLVDQRAEYPAIVANRTGMHTPHVERRCEELAERGLIEAVSGEVVYRVTDAGRRAVEQGRLPE
jgi:predicted transcriptional regulator